MRSVPATIGTVATHVRNIMNKLGFDSRPQIARLMASSSS